MKRTFHLVLPSAALTAGSKTSVVPHADDVKHIIELDVAKQ
jgi:hypothetical protein